MSKRSRDTSTRSFYRRVIQILTDARIPFLVGGGFALHFHTKIKRQNKDLDLFVYRRDWDSVSEVLSKAGVRTELTFPHWLGKAFHDRLFIDIIFSSGNGLCEVDRAWFKNSNAGDVLGLPVRFCAPEDMIWSKAFIMERERYDGADIAHLLVRCAERLDWNYLLQRFGSHWRVLLNHLILFGYIYPSERLRVPETVIRELLRRLEDELTSPVPDDLCCHGPLLSRTQYRADVEQLGYRDPRILPEGNMSPEETTGWTEAGEGEAKSS